MGDHREQFIDLDTPDGTAEQRARAVRTFLRSRGLAEPHERANDERWPDAIVDQAGPAWQSTWHEYSPGPQPSWWNTIAVVSPTGAADGVFLAMDSTGPSSCRACGERFDEDVFWSAFSSWHETGTEPVLSCTSCGQRGLMGDQDTTGSAVIGRVAVVTNGATPQVVSEMLRALRSDLGGRWAFVELND